MDEELRGLCAKHDLRCISVMYQGEHWDHFTVYLHLPDGDRCATGSGKTVERALEEGLREVRDIRETEASE